MVGKRPNSGQPGNLNASKHPWRSYWRRRALKPEHGWILSLVDDYEDEIIQDLGGRDQVSAAQRRTAEIARAARVCWLLALSGGADKGLSEAGRYMNAELKALMALGLERRPRPVQSLAAYLETRKAAAASGVDASAIESDGRTPGGGGSVSGVLPTPAVPEESAAYPGHPVGWLPSDEVDS